VRVLVNLTHARPKASEPRHDMFDLDLGLRSFSAGRIARSLSYVHKTKSLLAVSLDCSLTALGKPVCTFRCSDIDLFERARSARFIPASVNFFPSKTCFARLTLAWLAAPFLLVRCFS
jgi:hypothetical protein